MRFIKLALISIVCLFLLMLAMSLLLPSTIHLTRTIDIHAPCDSVYELLNNVERWKEWYPEKSASKMAYSENTTGRGASITIDKTLVVIRDNSKHKISTVWQTGKAVPVLSDFNFRCYDTASVVSLQWLFVQKVKWYPWEKFAAILSDKAIGPFMEQSLDNIKKRAEATTTVAVSK